MSSFICLSNRVECLLDDFKHRIFKGNAHPLTRRLVIVSSPAIKSWLMLQLAKDPTLGIAAGLEVRYLDEAIEKLRGEFSPDACRVPSLLELEVLLELHLKAIVTEEHHDEIWKPLFDYLQVNPGALLSKKSERRLGALASSMASLFNLYGKYGSRLIEEWKNRAGWQEALWQRIFHKNSQWTYLYKTLGAPFQVVPDGFEIHLFSVSHIPPLYHRYLERFADHVPFCRYVLSPCQYYWSDIRSDKEVRRLAEYWKGKGAAEGERESLEEILRDCNPLLANFGRIGREMAVLIENFSGQTHDYYTLPESIKSHPELNALVDFSTQTYPSQDPLTLLEAIQADMLLLRNPETGKLNFEYFDESIQVHSSCNRMREVEDLYDLIAGILVKHSSDAEPILPEDVIVMAPDISEYEPFIRMVFDSPESQISAHVMDICSPSQGTLAQAFNLLLSLAESRWSSADVMQLFECKAFQEKQGLHPEEIEQFRDWVQNAGICWGYSQKHKQVILERDHGEWGSIEQNNSNTWERGFELLLHGMVDDTAEIEVSAAKGEVLGKFLYLIESLKCDLKPLEDGSELNLSEWASILRHLRDNYFPLEDNALEEALNAIHRIAKIFDHGRFPFSSIRRYMSSLLDRYMTNYRESRLNTATFCSMLPMRSIPAKVIVLLGMQEGNYPRSNGSIALNMMAGSNKADFYPSQTDFDRYLFLEALLSARKYFIMSYLRFSANDFKEQMPSLVVAELLKYCDRAFQVGGNLLSSKCLYTHPYQSFDSTYFKRGSSLRSYSKARFKDASIYYQLDKKKSFSFLPSFQFLSPKPPQENIYLNLSELASFAKNPLKLYFNKRLGIYLRDGEERTLKSDESLLPSRLDYHLWKFVSLKMPFEDLLLKQNFPKNVFGKVAIESLKEKIDGLKTNLASVDVDPKDFVRFELSEHHKTAICDNTGLWCFPPLRFKMESAEINIVGKIDCATPQGLLEHVENDKDVFKIWPNFLAYRCLVSKHNLPFKTDLLFIKKGISKAAPSHDPELEMKRYLEYYHAGLERPSPLLPEWISSILKNEPLKISSEERNIYIKWLLRYSNLTDNVNDWRSIADAIFGHPWHAWFR